MSRKERYAWAALIAVALLLRLVALGDRPPHHDEAVHCDFGYNILHAGIYRYDPTYHGPLLFYVMTVLFPILGESTGVGRLYPTLAGAALVALPLLLRRRLGAATAWWTGVLLAISPNLLYYSRFARNEAPVALFTCAALAFYLLVRRKGWRPIPWIGVAAALHAISKETFYVVTPVLGLSAWVVSLRDGVWASIRRAFNWVDRYRLAVGTALLWFFVITVVAYTFFFIHPEDALFPLKAIQYWYQQHQAQRVGGPWFYHLIRLAGYEFLPIAATAVWAVRRRGRLKRLEVFCLAWGISAVIIFAYLGEKTPWLVVHQALPFMPLAGAQLARTFSPRGRWWSQGLAALGLAATLWSTIAANFLYPTISPSDPHAELLVFVQTTVEEQAFARRGLALAQIPREGPTAAVSGEGTWPLSWQWKKVSVWWALPEPNMRPRMVVCNPEGESTVRQRLGAGYSVQRVPLRAWWVEDVPEVTLKGVVRWFLTRKAWSGLGATDVLVFEAAGG